ncbi:hypothetical protein A1OQ_15715 [Enterovibrio norvegicus FF-162]|uniref:YccT family protein n=1 Tax=Enterovibrio norvegicus TaxID=188144 RepID=UPI0003039861|nr:DUF2057 domain-containing protein [Enterovibrio norvegicus]OEE87243.1 hypothetical protein A1OQ_15715 [Enterovibrio norvegicus FF-162]
MRRNLFLASVLAAMLPLSVAAEVTLHANNNVELLTYNGQSHKSSMFGKQEPVILENGTQQVAFRYVESFEEGKDISFIKSDVLVVTFDANDKDVYFAFPKHKNKRQARAFNDNPNFKLVDETNSSIAFEQNKLMKSGFQLSRDYLAELSRFNQTDASASLQLTAAPSTTVPRTSHVVVGSKSIDEIDYQLHYWFEKASPEAKARFKAYVNTQ